MGGWAACFETLSLRVKFSGCAWLMRETMWIVGTWRWAMDSGLWKLVVWLSAFRSIAVLLRDIVRVAWASLRSVNSIRGAGWDGGTINSIIRLVMV